MNNDWKCREEAKEAPIGVAITCSQTITLPLSEPLYSIPIGEFIDCIQRALRLAREEPKDCRIDKACQEAKAEIAQMAYLATMRQHKAFDLALMDFQPKSQFIFYGPGAYHQWLERRQSGWRDWEIAELRGIVL